MDRNLASALGITALALCLGGAAAWWITRVRTTTTVTSNNQTNFLTMTQRVATLPTPRGRTNAPGSVFTEPAPPLFNGVTWEERLDQILLEEGTDENAKADELLKMLPALDDQGQLEILQHVVNLVSDDHYEAAGQILTNHLAGEEVLSVLMTDLMNRTNTLKLPLLLQLVKNEEHPLRQEARDLLEFYVEEDYGTNWIQWDAAIAKWLKENENE